MRVLAMAMCAILAAGAFLSMGAPEARADVSGPAVATQTVATSFRAAPSATQNAAQPATRAEERDYARREAESPAAVKDASGGFVIWLLTVIVLVLLIVYLAHRT